ncbi:uncharacterized protein MONOS_11171 [Monocercomonoides exilis]|uniref:uncharacterized protein n=1 Tax=Monocercomonoides exilis TaxID=2049356 RepID=UPI00355A3814|nr:hypothetical protein MONOS_11171 [Monocercomonoides exilis]|eukprot:MONOS_11171.1-p1 / transcript=MONOS_11171.1 / gene=MONOS_11171 / organism=Monocercomonoides_exilis_PA203 / gene_product=unspecified product / transcript_product=unspecified product / location=Mono_scaffold00546:13689-14972(+) / protein_length=428 / sequence_SO=supercontig / SO=protein_coding / is_pseudo=false
MLLSATGTVSVLVSVIPSVIPSVLSSTLPSAGPRMPLRTKNKTGEAEHSLIVSERMSKAEKTSSTEGETVRMCCRMSERTVEKAGAASAAGESIAILCSFAETKSGSVSSCSKNEHRSGSTTTQWTDSRRLCAADGGSRNEAVRARLKDREEGSSAEKEETPVNVTHVESSRSSSSTNSGSSYGTITHGERGGCGGLEKVRMCEGEKREGESGGFEDGRAEEEEEEDRSSEKIEAEEEDDEDEDEDDDDESPSLYFMRGGKFWHFSSRKEEMSSTALSIRGRLIEEEEEEESDPLKRVMMQWGAIGAFNSMTSGSSMLNVKAPIDDFCGVMMCFVGDVTPDSAMSLRLGGDLTCSIDVACFIEVCRSVGLEESVAVVGPSLFFDAAFPTKRDTGSTITSFGQSGMILLIFWDVNSSIMLIFSPKQVI